MKLCWVGFWKGLKEYGAYILETIKAGEPELRGFGATSDLAKLAAEIKQLVKQHPKEGIAIRYEPPGTDIATLWADGSITLHSIDKDFRALDADEIAQFRKAFLEAQQT
ncbi:hypothetical protein KJA16_00715 [Patescibacteria group bacterium]|nr:hypothetical protein [Patescibacteria group bacterium]MBZ9578221.1 hypothetical protein [Patescibacteria group bacterium]